MMQSCPYLVYNSQYRQKFQLSHDNIITARVLGKLKRFQHEFQKHLDANAAEWQWHVASHTVNFM